MKKFEILWELPKTWHKDTKWANAAGNGTNRLAWPRAATDFHFVFLKNKSQLSVKHSKVEHDKMRYACALENQYDTYPVWAKLCTFQWRAKQNNWLS